LPGAAHKNKEEAMSEAVHPVATHHLPPFITAPGETGVLFYVTVGVLIISIVAVGVLYFRLHALPEHIAHRTSKVQYEIVAVLALLALFTHNHTYWIAGLLLAMVQLPDFSTPLARIAESLAKMAGAKQPLPNLQPLPNIEPLPPPRRAPGHQQQAAGEVKELSHA
jgi:hypothetical protein